MRYEELFERNLGIFEPEEQERIRNARVVIVGTGGIGGAVTLILARSGVEHFVLIEHDTYQPSNMNRQITCFSDTLGVNKAISVREALLKINPEIEVVVHQRALTADQIEEAIKLADVIVPAADDWALSITILGVAKMMGKPAVMSYPAGALGRAATFLPESPFAAECLSVPSGLPYHELKEFMERPDFRRLAQYYQIEGGWREEWFNGWCEGELPHPQICTIVWITASLAALEVLKLVTGKWEPVVAPRYWHITPTNARIKKFGAVRRLMSRLSSRAWVQKQLPALAKRKWLLRIFTRAIK